MKVFINSYLQRAPGRVKRRELLSYLREQMKDPRLTDRAMRKAIEEMVVDDGYLIQSSSTGYTLITSEEQMEEVKEYLSKKAQAIAVRKNVLISNWNKRQEEEQKKLSTAPCFQVDLFSKQMIAVQK